MTEEKIQSIYNNLFKWEGKSASKPYPIHKRLDTETFKYNDIYEWISKTYKITKEIKVLDAGCGVGYGAIYLSETHKCKVDGISLSNEEIKMASKFASERQLNDLVKFEVRSYDDLNPNKYDLIIAIESVKHTLDIEKTKVALTKALKPNGTLVIIDDFFNGIHSDKTLKKYAKDWALKVILKQSHFSTHFTLKFDLTPYVRTKNSVQVISGIVLFSLMKPFSKVASIIRGGLYLEKLFRAQKMSYYALEYKK